MLKPSETFRGNRETPLSRPYLFRGLRDRGRLDQTPKDKLDLTRLRARMAEKPRTKAGQVRQAWPDIKALFDAGHSLKDIWMWLNEIGIEIGYARLSHYTGQLKRRDQTAARAESIAASPDARMHREHSLRRHQMTARETESRPEEVRRLRTTRSQTFGNEKTAARAFSTTPIPT